MTNKKLAKIFREAKANLSTGYGQTGSEVFICHAIDNTSFDMGIGEAIDIIQTRLNGLTSIEDWLVHNKYLEKNELVEYTRIGQIQAFRHRWLDSLIKEFS